MLFLIIFAAVILLRLATYNHRRIKCKRLRKYYLKWHIVNHRKIILKSAEILEILRLGNASIYPEYLDTIYSDNVLNAFDRSLSYFKNELKKTIYPNFLLKSLFLAPICLIDLLNSRGISVHKFVKSLIMILYFIMCSADLLTAFPFFGLWLEKFVEFLAFIVENLG